MTYSQWKNQALGRHIDVDGYYGAQCVDVYLDYVQKYLGVSNWGSVTGYGDAAAIFPKANQNYFTKMGPAGLPQQGDVIFYGPTATNSAGHVAIVDSANNSGVQTIEQDGFNPGGVCYTKFRPWNGLCIGWQRPKVTTSNQGTEDMNEGDVINMYHAELGREPDPGGLKAYTGRPWKEVWYSIVGSQEWRNRQAQKDQEAANLRQQLVDTQTALQNEKNKPPIEVIKEVEKIVNVPVEVIKEVRVEVEPNWLGKVRDAVLTFLKLKKG